MHWSEGSIAPFSLTNAFMWHRADAARLNTAAVAGAPLQCVLHTAVLRKVALLLVAALAWLPWPLRRCDISALPRALI